MASHPLGPGAVPPSEWQTSAHVYTHSHLMACLRAGAHRPRPARRPRAHRPDLKPDYSLARPTTKAGPARCARPAFVVSGC